jgi:tetratricopeptide (TPR) repeat protein
MSEYQYDVFISYTSADKEWVRKTFVPALEKAALKCCEYYRDFDLGAPIVKEMERAILQSRKTILVLSPAYLKSDWAAFENLMLQTLDAANQERRLLPVIYGKCDLPLRFGYLNCVNFDHPDDIELEWSRLFKALKAPEPAPTVPTWHFPHRYGDRPNFTGRVVERKLLTDWLNADGQPLFILRALGGFGKSALSWHWLNNDVDKNRWQRVSWWSFYEGDASFEHFLGDTLEYLGIQDANKMNPRQQTAVLLGQLQDADILLVLDGFERVLRAFSGMGAAYQGDESPLPVGEGQGEGESRGRDCVSPAAEDFLRGLNDPKLRGKILMTTRLRPHVLETHDADLQSGSCEKELTALTPDDAYTFFTEKEKITATRAEVEAACAPYDYHPLSLNLLAGLIKKDFEYPRDMRAAEKYKIIGDIKNHKEHILKAAYETLPAERQQLLSQIACLRGSADYDTIKTIFSPAHLDQALHDLQDRGLLQVTTLSSSNSLLSTFDLHPIVRRYAYDRLTAPDKTAAHTRLADYFAAVPQPQKIEKLYDLTPMIELYHHRIRAGKFDEACDSYYERLEDTVFYQLGAYQVAIELLQALFPDGENNLPHLRKDKDQAWALNALANVYSMSGQPRRAVPLYEKKNEMRENMGDKKNLAGGLGAVASVALLPIGALTQAERNLRRRIDLCHEIEDELWGAAGYRELGRVLSYRGAWQTAEQELDAGLKLFEKHDEIQSQGIIWSYRALRCLLMAREAVISDQSSVVGHQQFAIEYAKRALELADEMTRTQYPVERDYVRAHWLLGAAYRASGDLPQAETHLGEALRRCRGINLVEVEADILLEVAKLSFDYWLRAKGGPQPSAQDEVQNYFDGALRLAREALLITERSGYVLQGADVNLFLAELALTPTPLPHGEGLKAWGGREVALMHARQARALATCNGGEYVYKVAYEEAGAMIQRMKDEG